MHNWSSKSMHYALCIFVAFIGGTTLGDAKCNALPNLCSMMLCILTNCTVYGDRNWQGGQNQNWHSQGQRNQSKPQWQNRNQQRSANQGSFGPQQYNFSNAPRHFNNTPIAMDMSTDRNRMDRHWNPRAGRGPQANVASTDCPFRGKCFNCKKEGHITRDCTTPKRSHINTAHIDDWATFEEGTLDLTYTKEDNRLMSSI